jgi:hypothetical protein
MAVSQMSSLVLPDLISLFLSTHVLMYVYAGLLRLFIYTDGAMILLGMDVVVCGRLLREGQLRV